MRNRDFYILIGDLIESQKNNQRSLEEYLLAFWSLASQYKHEKNMSIDTFLKLLKSAFVIDIPPFLNEWRYRQFSEDYTDKDDFFAFEETILKQIVDLREMDETDLLSNEMRYFGLESPRGSRWFNFEPSAYLECATEGSFGGWEDGDPTGRQYVPGEVAFLDQDNSIKHGNPKDLNRTTKHLNTISWNEISDFFWCGQIYE